MNARTLAKILMLALVLCLAVVLCCACDNKNDKDETPELAYLDEDTLYLASGCDHSRISSYFQENGADCNSYYEIQETQYNVSEVIRFYPSSKEIVVICGQQDNKSESGYVYQYTYAGAITVSLNQSLLDAKYNGYYSQQAVNLSSSANGYYSAKFTYSNIRYISLNEISKFDDISFTSRITDSSNYIMAEKHFNSKEIGQECYLRITTCLSYLNSIFKKIDDTYEIAGKRISESTCSHIAVTDKGRAPTCTSEGLTDGAHCKLCNKILTAQQRIEAKGHTPVIDQGRESTCTETGLSEGSHCSVCGTIIKEQVQIPCCEHNYNNGKCVVCSKVKPSDDLSYYLHQSSNECSVNGRGSCSDSIIVIDDFYNSEKVTSISANAFQNDAIITQLILPKSIKAIGTNAFMNCTNLRTIKYQGTTQEWRNNVITLRPWYGIQATCVICSDGIVTINTAEKF